MRLHGLFVAVALFLASPAAAIGFGIVWTGPANFFLTGSFSYSDGLIGSGAITAADLDTFFIEGFDGAVSLGTFDYILDAPLIGSDTFNFNFDTTTETFLVGGLSGSATGQLWATSTSGNTCATTGFGFASGSGGQVLCSGGTFNNASFAQNFDGGPFAIPEPFMGLLLCFGLTGLAMLRRRMP